VKKILVSLLERCDVFLPDLCRLTLKDFIADWCVAVVGKAEMGLMSVWGEYPDIYRGVRISHIIHLG
jgi:hypothetical protein